MATFKKKIYMGLDVSKRQTRRCLVFLLTKSKEAMGQEHFLSVIWEILKIREFCILRTRSPEKR